MTAKDYVQHHKFWAIVMVISLIMCVFTGHKITHPASKED